MTVPAMAAIVNPWEGGADEVGLGVSVFEAVGVADVVGLFVVLADGGFVVVAGELEFRQVESSDAATNLTSELPPVRP